MLNLVGSGTRFVTNAKYAIIVDIAGVITNGIKYIGFNISGIPNNVGSPILNAYGTAAILPTSLYCLLFATITNAIIAPITPIDANEFLKLKLIIFGGTSPAIDATLFASSKTVQIGS